MRKLLYSLVLAFALIAPAATLFIGSSVNRRSSFRCLQFLGDNTTGAAIILCSTGFIVLAVFMYYALSHLQHLLLTFDCEKEHRIDFCFSRRSIAVTGILLFAFWIPIAILLFPCSTTGYDTLNQLYQFFTDAPTYYSATKTVVDASFIDHHPIFDTLLFGGFTALGRSLGSDNLGMFLYSVFQNTITAGAFAVAICYLERLRIPHVIRLCSFLFTAITPIISVGASTMQKDSIFSPLFLLYFVCYLEVFRTKGKALNNMRFLVALLAIACLCCLTKKTGMPICCASFLILFLLFANARKESLLLAAATPLICAIIIPAVLFPALNVARGGCQEALGLLYHQAVTVVKAGYDDVEEADIKSIDAVIDLNAALQDYTAEKTDGVKRHQRDDATVLETATFLGTYLKLGIAHPADYAKAHLLCCGYLLIPSNNFGISTSISQKGIATFQHQAEALGQTFTLDAENPEELQLVVNLLLQFYGSILCTYPPTSLLFTVGFYGSWIPAITFSLTLFRNKKATLALSPYLLSALALLICPASLSRYALSLVYLAVPACGWCLHQYLRSTKCGPTHNPIRKEPHVLRS